jgi:RNA polymerase sigma-70 factor (ECF subfamily)
MVGRVAAGDDRALAALYDQYAPYVHRLAWRVTRDRSTAEDVVQEVFVHLWTKADQFDQALGSLRSWFGVLAHRRSVDRVRREEARRAREDGDHRRTTDATPSVEEAAASLLLTDRVRGALLDLPEEQRACIELAYFGGHTFREVAVRLGIAEGTAKSRIRLGLGKLADALEGAQP